MAMSATELSEWQKRLRLTNRRAADELALSERAYRRQKSGASPVHPQTERLAYYVELVLPSWLNIAEMALKVAKVASPAR